MKLRLELMAPISPYCMNKKREPFYYIINEINGTTLIMPFIDLQCPNSCSIIYRCKLIPSHFFTLKIC